MTVDITFKTSAVVEATHDSSVRVIAEHGDTTFNLTPGRWLVSEKLKDGKFVIECLRIS